MEGSSWSQFSKWQFRSYPFRWVDQLSLSRSCPSLFDPRAAVLPSMLSDAPHLLCMNSPRIGSFCATFFAPPLREGPHLPDLSSAQDSRSLPSSAIFFKKTPLVAHLKGLTRCHGWSNSWSSAVPSRLVRSPAEADLAPFFRRVVKLLCQRVAA